MGLVGCDVREVAALGSLKACLALLLLFSILNGSKSFDLGRTRSQHSTCCCDSIVQVIGHHLGLSKGGQEDAFDKAWRNACLLIGE